MSSTLSTSVTASARSRLASASAPPATASASRRSKVFFGFSTVDTDHTGVSALYDIALINRDLLNAFYTRRGERVMRPDWGCALWEMIMEPLTPLLHDQIVAEAVRICQLDSRLVLLDTKIFDYQNGIRIELTLNYLPFNVINSFTATFENRQSDYFSSNRVLA